MKKSVELDAPIAPMKSNMIIFEDTMIEEEEQAQSNFSKSGLEWFLQNVGHYLCIFLHCFMFFMMMSDVCSIQKTIVLQSKDLVFSAKS